jgi:hypothetical protein
VLPFAMVGKLAAGLVADTFALEGTELAALNGAQLSRFPHYWGPPELDTSAAVIFIGADVWDPHIYGGSLRLRMDPSAPHKLPEPVIRSVRDLTREERIRLMDGYALMQPDVRHSAHRPPGTGNFALDEEQRAFESLNQFLEQKERDGVKISSVQMLAGEWGVLGRSQTFELFKQFPRLRERYRQHKQRPRRRP